MLTNLPLMSSILPFEFVLTVLVTSVGSGFQHGYHSGVLNIPADVLQDWIRQVKKQRTHSFSDSDIRVIWSTALSIFSIGGVLGGLLIGVFADRCGRKWSLMWNNVIVLTAIIILACSKKANSYELFIFGRFLSGINAGLNGGLCLIYLAEISPDNIRGAIGSFYQLVVAVSILFSQIIGFFVSSPDHWPHIFLVAIGPAIFQFASLPFCTGSPKFFLIGQGNENKAEKALKRLRGTENVEEEFERLKEEENLVQQLHVFSIHSIVSNPYMKDYLICCFVINVAQQMCGINAVTYFSYYLFEEIKIDTKTASLITIGMSIFGLPSAVTAIFLIDRIGRLPLLRISFLGLIVDTILLALGLLTLHFSDYNKHAVNIVVFLYYLFFAIYAIGIGPIPMFIPAELFTYSSRSLAVCLSVAVNWFTSFLVIQVFLILQNVLGHSIFLIFIVMDIVCYIFIRKHLPETKHVTARDLLQLYNP